jgi:hypothetical protein
VTRIEIQTACCSLGAVIDEIWEALIEAALTMPGLFTKTERNHVSSIRKGVNKDTAEMQE